MKLIQTIEYPLSPDYQPEWGPVEALREVIANALDTGTTVRVSYRKNGVARVRDQGEGVQRRHLVMGISEKNTDVAIGQFGEGMKLAALVFARGGRKFGVETGDLILKFSLRYSETFETDCLVMKEYQRGSSIQGTQVFAECSEDELDDAKQLFLRYQKNVAWLDKENGIIEEPGNLFIRGVFIKSLYAPIFSYNLDDYSLLNRDRSSIGDREIVTAIGEVIEESNGKVWRRMIDNVLDFIIDGGTLAFEWRNGLAGNLYSAGDTRNQELMKERLRARGIRHAVLSENPEADKLAVYRGYTVLRADYNTKEFLTKAGIPYASEILNEEDFRVESQGINAEQTANLELAEELARLVCTEYRVDTPQFEVYESITMSSGKPVAAECDRGIPVIRLVEEVLNDTLDTLGRTSHELAHHISGDGDFGSHFQGILADIGALAWKWWFGK